MRLRGDQDNIQEIRFDEPRLLSFTAPSANNKPTSKLLLCSKITPHEDMAEGQRMPA